MSSCSWMNKFWSFCVFPRLVTVSVWRRSVFTVATVVHSAQKPNTVLPLLTVPIVSKAFASTNRRVNVATIPKTRYWRQSLDYLFLMISQVTATREPEVQSQDDCYCHENNHEHFDFGWKPRLWNIRRNCQHLSNFQRNGKHSWYCLRLQWVLNEVL